MLYHYGIDLGHGEGKLSLPRGPTRSSLSNGDKRLDYKNFSIWLGNPSSFDYNLELNVVRRFFWIDQFWNPVFLKYLSVTQTHVTDESNDLDMHTTDQYFTTNFTAPMQQRLSSSPFDRLRESLEVFRDIGVDAFCFAVKSEKQLETLQEWKNLSTRITRQCLGPDLYWTKNLEKFDEADPESDDGWGCLYVFPFPFTIIFVPDDCTEMSGKSPLVYSMAEKLPKEADGIALERFVESLGYNSIAQYLEEDQHSISTLRTDRVQNDVKLMKKILQVNCEHKRVLFSKCCREDLKALDRKLVSLPSTNALGCCWSRNRLFVLNDIQRHQVRYEKRLKKLLPQVLRLSTYPLLSQNADWFAQRQLSLVPGLHTFFEMETPRGGVIKKVSDCLRCGKDSTLRMSFNNERLEFMFHPQKRGQVVEKPIREFFENTTSDRRKDLQQLRSDIAVEFEKRARDLPHGFLVDVYFNPDISKDQFDSLGILFDRLDLFSKSLERAIDFQQFLKSLSPRSFIWFMFWTSVYYRNRVWVRGLVSSSIQLLTPFRLPESDPTEISIAMAGEWNELDESQVSSFVEFVKEKLGGKVFTELCDKVVVKSKERVLAFKDVIKRLTVVMHDEGLPVNWESAKDQVRLQRKGIYPQLDVIGNCISQHSRDLREFVRFFEPLKALAKEEQVEVLSKNDSESEEIVSVEERKDEPVEKDVYKVMEEAVSEGTYYYERDWRLDDFHYSFDDDFLGFKGHVSNLSKDPLAKAMKLVHQEETGNRGTICGSPLCL